MPSLRIVRASGDVPDGRSKLGGRPDLPHEMPWPVEDGAAQAFICQLDFAEVTEAFPPATAVLAQNGHSLPIGHILFFVDPELRAVDDDPMEIAGHVLRLPPGAASVRREFPEELDEDVRFRQQALEFRAERMEVPVQAPEVDELGLSSEEQVAWGKYVEPDDSPRHRMFGYPESILFEDPRESDAQTLLLQVDSDEAVGMEWGDDGRLFFLIRRDALAAHRFDDVRLVYQSH